MRSVRPRLLRRALVLGVLGGALVLGACSSGGGARSGGRAGAGGPGGDPADRGPKVTDDRVVRAAELDADAMRRFREAWHLFVLHDYGWPAARDAWLAEGGAAPYLLAENLFRYFWSASKADRRDEIARVGAEAARVGEPAVAYFAKALVTDRWPLPQPVTVEVFNPDNVGKPIQKTFTHFDIDDVTRQHAAKILAWIGPPAVPTLASPAVVASPIAGTRRYGAYALGAIATDEAVALLGRLVREGASWQDRGAAAKALGFALHKNASARPYLEAALQDPDPFVREKAQEGLDGRTRLEF